MGFSDKHGTHHDPISLQHRANIQGEEGGIHLPPFFVPLNCCTGTILTAVDLPIMIFTYYTVCFCDEIALSVEAR